MLHSKKEYVPMAENNSLKEKSLLSLYIFEILRKFSNKESPMTEKEIKDTINNAEIFGDDAYICTLQPTCISPKYCLTVPLFIT